MIRKAFNDLVNLLWARFTITRCPQVAGSLTFTTLLAIVPLVTVSLSLFSHFPAFQELGEALSAFMQTNILPDRAGQIVTTYALQFSEKAAELTLVGTAMLVVAIILLLHTIDGVFNDIWGVRSSRPLLTRLTVYWFVLTIGPFALAGSVFATGRLVASSAALIGTNTQVNEAYQAFSSMAVPFGLLGVLFSFLYFAVPNHPVRIWHAAIGGCTSAIAFIAMQRVLGGFIAGFPTYTLVYGTFAALPIFLAWLYTSWVIILFGAILTATLPEFLDRKKTMETFPGDKAFVAITMLSVLAKAHREGHPVSFDTLRTGASVSQDFAERTLGDLRDAGWAARTDEQSWILSRNPEQLTVLQVVRRFALDPAKWRQSGGNTPPALAAARIESGLSSADITIAELASLHKNSEN